MTSPWTSCTYAGFTLRRRSSASTAQLPFVHDITSTGCVSAARLKIALVQIHTITPSHVTVAFFFPCSLMIFPQVRVLLRSVQIVKICLLWQNSAADDSFIPSQNEIFSECNVKEYKTLWFAEQNGIDCELYCTAWIYAQMEKKHIKQHLLHKFNMAIGKMDIWHINVYI